MEAQLELKEPARRAIHDQLVASNEPVCDLLGGVLGDARSSS
jgi:hypothetical protein